MPNAPETYLGQLRKANGRGRPEPERRASAAARGYDHRWQKIRAMQLRREPLCRICKTQGLTVPATDVDHITPRRRGGSDRMTNLQSLCHTHHSQKTGREKWQRE